jgi:hypothetical protein
MRRAGPNVFIVGAGVVVTAALVAGFVTVGTPDTARKLRFDQMRLAALINLSNRVGIYFRSHGALPATLQEAAADGRLISDDDPQTGKSYEYIVKDKNAYALCAVFTLPSSAQDDLPPQAFVAVSVVGAEATGAPNRWDHAAGRQCFDFVAEGRAHQN